MFTLPEPIQKIVHKNTSKFSKVVTKSLKLKKEKVLIISDYGIGDNLLAAMLGNGYYHALKAKKEVEILWQSPKKGFMFAENHVVRAILNLPKNSVIVLCLSNKLGRFGKEKSFRTYCKFRGHRFLSATGLGDVKTHYFDQFIEAMTVNYDRMKKKGTLIKKAWDKAKTIRVRTEAGTDVTFGVEGMSAIANVGLYHEPGQGGNMPAGEVYIPPAGVNNVNGVFVVDGSIKTAEGAFLLDEPVIINIVDGRVVSIEGKHAHLLEETFQKFENRAKYPERIRLASELGIGINPGAVLIGSTIMDEKVMGAGHIAFGSNYWFGGDIKTIYHGDNIFKAPMFYVDGEKMVF